MGHADGGNTAIMAWEAPALLPPVLVERLGLRGVGQDRHPTHILERLLEEGIGPCEIDLACPASAWWMTCKRPRSSFAITMMGTACAWGGMVAARATYVGSPRRITVNTSVSKAFIAGTHYRACDRPPDKCR